MKNRFLYLLLPLLLCGVLHAEASNVGAGTRRDIAQTLTRIVDREVVGVSVQIKTVKSSRKRVQIYASIELSYYPFREANVRAMRDSVRALLPSDLQKATLELYTDTREIGELIPMAFRSPVVATKSRKQTAQTIPFTNRSAVPLVRELSAASTPSQGLSGRHIALWQSHGRYYDQTERRWRWQRSMLWETCEDLYTQSYVLPYLVPMLENAGAYVLMPRERDVQKQEFLADNDDNAVTAAATTYREQGSGWSEGGVGFAHKQEVYRTGDNPFRQGTTRRVRTEVGGSSRATWSVTFPEADEYALYVSYESTPQSADDALYIVHHSGGESRFSVNQTMGGGTWIYLGHFSFAAGTHDVVSLSNRSLRAGRTLSADAVKVGGGFGNVARTVCDSLREPRVSYTEELSGYPRFCEGARYWLQWAGFDKTVYSPKNNGDDYKDDFMSRALWVNALMGGSERLPDSVGLRIPVDMALAFHSDAGVRAGDEVIGTLGIYFTRDNGGRFVGGADRYRSRDLTDLVMTQIVGDIRQTYEPTWRRRGLWNRSYYEARVPAVPTMLLELLSHQNFADMRLGSDPRFKFLVGRAIYKGVLRYLSSQYGTPYVVQPLPVEAFSVAFEGDASVRLRWTPVLDSLESTAAPTGYVVYTRIDDGGFDNGRYTAQPNFTTPQEAGRIYSYRITAVNEGGESFPSETLSACRVKDEKGILLIVNGFDRVSAAPTVHCDSLAGFCHEQDSGVPDGRDISFIGHQRVYDPTKAGNSIDSIALGASGSDFASEVIGGNTFDYPYVHGRSVAAAGYSFSSASVRAVERGEVLLNDFGGVDLILGKQLTMNIGRGVVAPQFRVFTVELQDAVRRYVAQSGAIFVSGCYVASDLLTNVTTSAADRAFAEEVLHFSHGGSQTLRRGVVRATASEGGFARGEFRYDDHCRPDGYRIERVDALKPAGAGAFSIMRYVESNRTAGVAWSGGGRTCVVGFPFESLRSAAERDRMMEGVLNFLFDKK